MDVDNEFDEIVGLFDEVKIPNMGDDFEFTEINRLFTLADEENKKKLLTRAIYLLWKNDRKKVKGYYVYNQTPWPKRAFELLKGAWLYRHVRNG